MFSHVPNFLTTDLCDQTLTHIRSTSVPHRVRDMLLTSHTVKINQACSVRALGLSFSQTLIECKDQNLNLEQIQIRHQAQSQQLEPLLRKDFGFFYDIFQKKISQLLDVNAIYVSQLGLPGFQIINDSHLEGEVYRVWHYDDNLHAMYDWKKLFPDFTTVEEYFDACYSFTILIDDPGYTSYDYYPDTHCKFTSDVSKRHNPCTEHIGLQSNDCPNEKCALKHMSYQHIQYHVGDLLLVQDRYLHRVGRTEYTKSGHDRITFQGFGARVGKTVYLHF